MNTTSFVSIVCPVYNEEEAILAFYNRIKSVMAPLSDRYEYELVFTNNCSEDGTLDIISSLRESDKRVQALTLSRNFGYQASVLAGINYSIGDATVVIDVDCEDPPEMLPIFLEKWREGYDIVYGLRGDRPEPRMLVAVRRLFYRILKMVADTDIILDMAEFALVTARVRSEMSNNSNSFPFLRAEIGYAGFSRLGIKYDRQKRVVGKSKYNLWKMLKFAVAGIVSVSTFPLRFAVYAWPFLVALNVFFLWSYFDKGWINGLFVLVALDLIYAISMITVHGVYLARIYKNIIARPIFVIDWNLSLVNRLPK